MSLFVSRVKTALALGLPNIIRALFYRLGVKFGINPVRRLRANVPRGPFFGPIGRQAQPAYPAPRTWLTSANLFSHWPIGLKSAPPDWLANPFNDKRLDYAEKCWWQIPDFDPAVGDIKLIWELSRMDWALVFAQHARQGDPTALARLNDWLADWCEHNSPYRGPNWKCGQEASIRVMHLTMAALVLGQACRPASGLLDLVHVHLERIAPTVHYAMAQDNNHGTSEAAALFIGGSWLAQHNRPNGRKWERMGRSLLENRAARLIGPQGSFSQYSLNYHRVLLDTFCMAEVARRCWALEAFSERWQARALAATQWLYHMVNAENGDGPNAGANDGARLLQLSDTPYRDHRPSVQLAMALFANQRAYAQDGPYNGTLHWLGIPLPSSVSPPPRHWLADDGGFAVLRRGRAMAMLRYPRFRFRPSQADVLHLDLWLGGDNLLRDAGTYSYYTAPHWLAYFGGSAGHNTVQFDDRDQMPRLSRFLLGDWLKTDWLEPITEDAQAVRFGAGYRDSQGASHKRHVTLSATSLQVQDEVTGFTRKALLSWRLMPGNWRWENFPDRTRLVNADNPALALTVRATMPLLRCELVEGWESRHYLEKTTVPVVEIEVQEPGTLTTEVGWLA